MSCSNAHHWLFLTNDHHHWVKFTLKWDLNFYGKRIKYYFAEEKKLFLRSADASTSVIGENRQNIVHCPYITIILIACAINAMQHNCIVFAPKE